MAEILVEDKIRRLPFDVEIDTGHHPNVEPVGEDFVVFSTLTQNGSITRPIYVLESKGGSGGVAKFALVQVEPPFGYTFDANLWVFKTDGTFVDKIGSDGYGYNRWWDTYTEFYTNPDKEANVKVRDLLLRMPYAGVAHDKKWDQYYWQRPDLYIPGIPASVSGFPVQNYITPGHIPGYQGEDLIRSIGSISQSGQTSREFSYDPQDEADRLRVANIMFDPNTWLGSRHFNYRTGQGDNLDDRNLPVFPASTHFVPFKINRQTGEFEFYDPDGTIGRKERGPQQSDPNIADGFYHRPGHKRLVGKALNYVHVVDVQQFKDLFGADWEKYIPIDYRTNDAIGRGPYPYDKMVCIRSGDSIWNNMTIGAPWGGTDDEVRGRRIEVVVDPELSSTRHSATNLALNPQLRQRYTTSEGLNARKPFWNNEVTIPGYREVVDEMVQYGPERTMREWQGPESKNGLYWGGIRQSPTAPPYVGDKHGNYKRWPVYGGSYPHGFGISKWGETYDKGFEFVGIRPEKNAQYFNIESSASRNTGYNAGYALTFYGDNDRVKTVPMNYVPGGRFDQEMSYAVGFGSTPISALVPNSRYVPTIQVIKNPAPPNPKRACVRLIDIRREGRNTTNNELGDVVAVSPDKMISICELRNVDEEILVTGRFDFKFLDTEYSMTKIDRVSKNLYRAEFEVYNPFTDAT